MPVALETKYIRNLYPASVVQSVPQMKLILNVDLETVTKKSDEYKIQKREVFRDTLAQPTLNQTSINKPWRRFHQTIGI